MNTGGNLLPRLNMMQKIDREQVPWGKGEKNSCKKVK